MLTIDRKTFCFTLFFLFGSLSVIFSQEENANAQMILSKFDSEIAYPQGTIRGKWVKKKGNTIFAERDFRIYKHQEEFLYEFDKRKGEIGFRILCQKQLKASERNIYFANQPAIALQKVSLETRREFNPELGFAMEELCQFPYQAYYTPDRINSYENAKLEYWKILIKPLEESGYSKLFIYSSQKTEIPYRIDFYMKNGYFTRMAKFREKEIPFRELNGKKENKKRIAVYSMTDLDTNFVYYLEIDEVIVDPTAPREILKIENMNRNKN